VRTVQTTRPAPEDEINRAPFTLTKPAFTKPARRHKGFSSLPVVDSPVIRRDSGECHKWFPDVTNFFKDAWRDLSEIGKEASTFGQCIMGVAVQELTEVGREVSSFSMDVVSDLKETAMELREISMDAPEQLQKSSKDFPAVIRNLLPTTLDCTSGCGSVGLAPCDEQLELTTQSTDEHVVGSGETASQAAVTFQTAPRARWIAGVSDAKVSHASAYEDFTKAGTQPSSQAARPCQHGNGATVTSGHCKEPCDAAFEELAKDKFWWARPSVSFVERGASSCSQASSTCAGESPAPSARGNSPLWSPIQTPRDPRTLVNWDITGSALSGAWESIDTNNALSAVLPL